MHPREKVDSLCTRITKKQQHRWHVAPLSAATHIFTYIFVMTSYPMLVWNSIIIWINFQQELYNNIPTETKVIHLIGALQNVELGDEGRQTAAVLLRRLLSAEFFEFFPKLPMEQQAAVREQLLLTLQMEVSQQLRRKVWDWSQVCSWYLISQIIIVVTVLIATRDLIRFHKGSKRFLHLKLEDVAF